MIFALAINTLSTTRVYTVLVLSALAAEMALLLANKTHRELEPVTVARLGTHPNGVACK
jgi:hypothetical protein